MKKLESISMKFKGVNVSREDFSFLFAKATETWCLRCLVYVSAIYNRIITIIPIHKSLCGTLFSLWIFWWCVWLKKKSISGNQTHEQCICRIWCLSKIAWPHLLCILIFETLYTMFNVYIVYTRMHYCICPLIVRECNLFFHQFSNDSTSLMLFNYYPLISNNVTFFGHSYRFEDSLGHIYI